MLAEAVHSVADTSNQGLLLFGQRQARKQADDLHQFGFGGADTSTRSWSRWCCSLSALCLRCTRATYKIVHPVPLSSPVVAIAILVVAIRAGGVQFSDGCCRVEAAQGASTWWQFIRRSRNPELPVVLLEDTGR